MDQTRPAFKPVKLKLNIWQEVKDLADELQDERGGSVSMPDAIAEAVKFMRENRSRPEAN